MFYTVRVSKLLCAVAFFICLYFAALSSVAAQDAPFDTTLETTYEVNQEGITNVTHKFTITNKTPTTFLKQYGLKLHSTQIDNIVVKNNNKDLTPEIKKESNRTEVGINFPDEVVGQGKRRTFTISYNTPDIADIAGRVLEIQIPPFAGSEQYTNHKVILYTPIQFGRAIRVTPQQTNFTIDPKGVVTTFDQPTGSAISAFFGEEQYYKMTLRYNLENESSSTGIAQIALPPDTSYQRIHIFSLEPPTNDIKIDKDGNWIATYVLEPQTTLPVYVTAAVKLTLEPNSQIPVPAPITEHLDAAKYWETSSSLIQEKAQQFQTPEDIYKHVVSTLTYSYPALETDTVLERLGGETAFLRPEEAVCQEFTDSFIAVARAAGIHARRLTGYAYTQNTTLRPLSLESDILHAWPEFYDSSQGRWHPVDPTWENTTGGIDYFHNFDLSHIVFAINGTSSTAPNPAGSYKPAAGNTKDIEVTFADNFPSIQPDLEVNIYPIKMFGFSLPGQYILSITNKTGQAWYDMNIQIQADDTDVVAHLETLSPLAILPNQTIQLPLQMQSQSGALLKPAPSSVTVSLPGAEKLYDQRHELTAGHQIASKLKDANLVLGVVSGIAIVAIGAGSILVFRGGRKSSVRRQGQKPQTSRNFLQLFKKTAQPNPPVGNDSSGAEVQDPGK